MDTRTWNERECVGGSHEAVQCHTDIRAWDKSSLLVPGLAWRKNEKNQFLSISLENKSEPHRWPIECNRQSFTVPRAWKIKTWRGHREDTDMVWAQGRYRLMASSHKQHMYGRMVRGSVSFHIQVQSIVRRNADGDCLVIRGQFTFEPPIYNHASQPERLVSSPG